MGRDGTMQEEKAEIAKNGPTTLPASNTEYSTTADLLIALAWLVVDDDDDGQATPNPVAEDKRAVATGSRFTYSVSLQGTGHRLTRRLGCQSTIEKQKKVATMRK